MREIKSRGKSKKDGKWVYGYFYEECGNTYIIENRQHNRNDLCARNTPHIVNPDTIGQFTGLKTKDGQDIYEGDIIDINYKYDACGINGVIPDQDCDCRGVVLYNQYTASYELRLIRAENPIDVKGYNEEYSVNLYSFDFQGYIDLCGNIYDNPELLEETK